MKWIIAGIVVIILVVFYAYSETRSGTPVRTIEAARGPIRSWVEDRAMTTLPLIHKITMPQDGRILPITLKAGHSVSKGEAVAQMDQSDLQSTLDLADAEVKEIQAQLEVNAYKKIETTALVESKKMIAALNATGEASNELVRTNEAELKYAQWLVEMEEKLVKQRASSKDKLERARRDYGQAESQLASARFMSRATWAIAAVVDLFPRYVRELLGRKHLEGSVLAQQLAGARAARDLAARRLERAVIKSPVDGIVLRRLVKNEAYLPAGTLLLEIGVMDDLQVTANILSQDVVAVRTGNPVDIYGPSIGPDPILGTVSRVKPAGFTKVSSLGVDQQRVPVVISFDSDALKKWEQKGRSLGLGYRVRVRIYTQKRQGVLKVPRSALFRADQNQWQVFSIRNDKAVLVPVTLGLINDNEAEIIEGLKAGDPVVVAPPKSLKAGDRVICS
jgi:HlyD family secretion protein